MNKFYLVLSVRDINRLARAAKKSAANSYGKDRKRANHCVVLNLNDTPTLDPLDGRTQLSSVSFRDSLAELEQTNKENEKTSTSAE